MRKIFAVLALVAASSLFYSGPPSGSSQEELSQETPHAPSERPNFIFVLTDDLAEGDLQRLSGLRAIMGEAGTTFENAYVTYSLCCPSRATILRGQYAHNHGIIGNTRPMGGHDKFRNTGMDQSTFATWLDDAGYRTAYIGKYFNGYDEMYVPPGWDEWFGWLGKSNSGLVNDNGAKTEVRGHSTDAFANRTTNFIRRASSGPEPFFAFVGTKAPHYPPEVAARYKDRFRASLPRSPSFDEADVSDKPRWIRSRERLADSEITTMKRRYRQRLASMLSVEDLLRRTVTTLEETGELKNTYVFFASDNGYHMGQHRLVGGKLTAYEEDISIPLMVRGPGVSAGRTLPHLVLNNDLAPTFADLAGAQVPDFVDGRSIEPLLAESPPPLAEWRTAFLVEGWQIESSVKAVPKIPGYKGLHTLDHTFVSYTTGEHELYYLPDDPYQLHSGAYANNEALYQMLGARLERLRDCAGDNCRVAENR